MQILLSENQQFELKMKAQMAYLKKGAEADMRGGFMSNSVMKKFTKDEYLWNTTPYFYVAAFGLFIILKNKFG